MTLSDSDEILPLLEHNRKCEAKSNAGYQAVLNLKKEQKLVGNFSLTTLVNDSENIAAFAKENVTTPTTFQNQSSVPSANFKIIYSWNKLNVYASQNLTNSASAWKKISHLTKRSSFNGNTQKHILNNVYGVAHPGEILAVMGPSGAGKSTLLNALTFQTGSNTKVSGQRYLNGSLIRHRNSIATQSAYVEQNTMFLGTLTVREHLIFNAIIRMDRTLSYQEKVKRVEDVITELGLEKCKNTVIGCLGRTSGLSGGEMRRLSFAAEILTNPSLLFCDEPTSGLDSFIALNVINVLKAMALRGKTVICTIHQPSSEMFSLFDKILLLAEGRTAFLGSPNDASLFFAELGASPLIYHNLSDIFIGLVSIVPKHEKSSKETINFVCDCFDQSIFGMEAARKIDCEGKNQFFLYNNRGFDPYNTKTNNINDNLGYKATWCTQFRALFWRSWLNVMKEPLLVKVRLFQTVVLSLIVGLIYHNQKVDENGVMNINGVLFTFLTNMTFQNLYAVINVFCSELPIFTKEYKNKMYRIDAYFLSKTLAEIPVFLAIPLIFTSIAYFWIGLNPKFEHFITTTVILILVTNVATSFGYLISCVSTNMLMAYSIGPPIIIPFLLFGGYLLNVGAIPPYFKWLSYFSWFKYGNEALFINQWADIQRIECTNSNVTCPKSGDIVLEMYHFKKGNFIWDIVSLGFLIIIFRLLAYLALVIRMKFNQRDL